MQHYGALRDYDVDLDADDIRGAALEDRSGNKIGTVTDAIIEHETGNIHYLAAAVGGREVLVPAKRVVASPNDETLRTDLTLGEAERLPAAEAERLQGGKATRTRDQQALSASLPTTNRTRKRERSCTARVPIIW